MQAANEGREPLISYICRCCACPLHSISHKWTDITTSQQLCSNKMMISSAWRRWIKRYVLYIAIVCLNHSPVGVIFFLMATDTRLWFYRISWLDNCSHLSLHIVLFNISCHFDEHSKSIFTHNQKKSKQNNSSAAKWVFFFSFLRM